MLRASDSANIYDLGYRHYEGPRLGRRQALRSLYLYSLRGAFGLGRGTGSKIIPIAIVLLAAVPALGQLAVAAIAPVNVSVVRPENYFDFVQLLLAIFCAAVAPDLFARDQRTHTLPLYFARGLRRSDYVAAKLAALITALLFVTMLPELVLFFGNGLASSDLGRYTTDHWIELFQVFATGIVVATFFGCIAAALGGQTPRRAYSTIAIIAVLILTSIVAAVITHTTGGVLAKAVVLVTPFEAAAGTTRWIFNATVGRETNLGQSGVELWWCFPALLASTCIAAFLAFRRFARITP